MRNVSAKKQTPRFVGAALPNFELVSTNTGPPPRGPDDEANNRASIANQ